MGEFTTAPITAQRWGAPAPSSGWNALLHRPVRATLVTCPPGISPDAIADAIGGRTRRVRSASHPWGRWLGCSAAGSSTPAVEIALIIRGPDGRYIHRRVRCAGNDVLSARGHFFDPDPQTLADCGKPSAPRRVEDHTFATLDQALQVAQTQDPAADANKWETAEDFEGVNSFTLSRTPAGARARRHAGDRRRRPDGGGSFCWPDVCR
jgi:hypothetical protein